MSLGKNFTAFSERGKAREPQGGGAPLYQRLKEISVPLMFIYGKQDRGSAAQRCALLKEQEPGLRIELIDNASHLIIWEAADKFNEALRRFLKS
jgi:pimeloyl-ACP methyl ester carboxylesterase